MIALKEGNVDGMNWNGSWDDVVEGIRKGANKMGRLRPGGSREVHVHQRVSLLASLATASTHRTRTVDNVSSHPTSLRAMTAGSYAIPSALALLEETLLEPDPPETTRLSGCGLSRGAVAEEG